MREILEQVIELIVRGESAAMASIVDARGSLPMSRRAKMLILPGGAQHGTVGGGCLEAEVHAEASAALRTGRVSLRRFTLTESQAGAEGLNCGGTVEILVEPVGPGQDADDPTIDIYRQAVAAMDAREETVLATLILPDDAGAGGTAWRVAGRALVGWKGIRSGAGLLAAGSPAAAFAAEEALSVLGQDRAGLAEAGGAPPGGRLFLETLNASPTLFLFGGGHVSLAVARVARTAGFRIVVVDDRPAFANAERFPEADQTLVLPMAEAVGGLPIDGGSYIVAVTRGHQHDEPVVEQAIRTPAAYIGMIGSRRKVAIMWKRLKERGATDEQLARVHAPIGLPIGGDSPGEIAVSIVAEMIQVRRAR